MNIDEYLSVDAERIGKNYANSLKKQYENLFVFSDKFPEIMRIVKESFSPEKSFWHKYVGPHVIDKNGKDNQIIIHAQDTPTLFSAFRILEKYFKLFCYLSNREAYLSLTAEEIKALESLLTSLSRLCNKDEEISIDEINNLSDLKILFPLDEHGELDVVSLEASEKEKSKAWVGSIIKSARKLLEAMRDYGTLSAIEDAKELETTIQKNTNEAVFIICDESIDAQEKTRRLQYYKDFIKGFVYAKVATLNNGKTIDLDDMIDKIDMYIGNDLHVLDNELIYYLNEVLSDPRDFLSLLILFHIFRLEPSQENAKLLSEGFRIHLGANIFENTYGRFDDPDYKTSPVQEFCDCAQKVISYFEEYEPQIAGFEKEEYVEDKKLTGIWRNEKHYQYWIESGLSMSTKLSFYRDMDLVASDDDLVLLKQMSDKVKYEQEETERVNKIRTAVDKVASSLNVVFLLEQVLILICNNNQLIPSGMTEHVCKIRDDLYKAETRIVRVVYKKKSILEEGRKKYGALDILSIENSEKNLSYKNEISLLKNMLKLSMIDIRVLGEEELISRMNDYVAQARVFMLHDEEIDEISKAFCDCIQEKISEHEKSFESLYNNLYSNYSPVYERFRNKVQGYLGDLYTEQVKAKMDSAFDYSIKSLATGEYLYRKYVPNTEENAAPIDYSSVALEYYLSLETLANLFLYMPYYFKHFCGNNWDSVSSSLIGGGTDTHMTRRGVIKESLEIGTLGFLYLGFDSRGPRGILSADMKYSGLKNYISIFDAGILGTVHDECVKLMKISKKRNESAHGGKQLAATAAKAAQGTVYIHDPEDDEAFRIEAISEDCRRLALEILNTF